MFPFLAPLLPAWTIIKKFWPYILIGLAILGVYFYWQGLLGDIKDLNAEIGRKNTEIATLETRLSTCEANFAGVKGSLDVQNSALGKIDGLLKKNQNDWKALVGKIDSSNDELSKRLAGILQEKKPETCEAAIKYLLDARVGYPK